MFTKSDLATIVDAISPLIKAEGELTRKDLKSHIDAKNDILGQILRIQLAAQKQDIIDLIQTQKFKQLENRVSKLEEQQSPTHH